MSCCAASCFGASRPTLWHVALVALVRARRRRARARATAVDACGHADARARAQGFVDVLTTTDCIDVDGDVRNGCWHVDHNTGLVFMRSRPKVLEFTAAWKQKIETTRDIMIRDQAALNLLMRENFRSRVWKPPPDPDGGQEVRAFRRAGRDHSH